jgi:tetratricopeptide (TPR) repeat protein
MIASRLAKVMLCAALAACGGGSKGGSTTPKAGGGSAKGSGSDSQSMADTGTPTFNGSASGGAVAGGPSGSGSGSGLAGGGQPLPPDPVVVFPNQDPDPAQAKSQVDQHLAIAKAALSQVTPDGDAALREAREALKIDAASIDAAAYVAYGYFAKKQLDTAELVLDELFKRPSAKQNANVYYVYGLVYDHTNRPEQAVLAFKQAVSLDPNLGGAQQNLGMHQLLNKQYADAQATFEKLTSPPFNRSDAVTMTSLGSAYRGHAGDYPPGSGERNNLVSKAEVAYKTANRADPSYGQAYYNLGLLYLDFDNAGGSTDALTRLTAAEGFFTSYKNSPGFDLKLLEERMKDVTKAKKRAQKAAKAKKA